MRMRAPGPRTSAVVTDTQRGLRELSAYLAGPREEGVTAFQPGRLCRPRRTLGRRGSVTARRTCSRLAEAMSRRSWRRSPPRLPPGSAQATRDRRQVPARPPCPGAGGTPLPRWVLQTSGYFTSPGLIYREWAPNGRPCPARPPRRVVDFAHPPAQVPAPPADVAGHAPAGPRPAQGCATAHWATRAVTAWDPSPRTSLWRPLVSDGIVNGADWFHHPTGPKHGG